MSASRQFRMWRVGVMMTGVAIALGLILFALNENINLFYTPEQVVNGEVPEGQSFRLGGMVVVGSVKRAPDTLEVSFGLTDLAQTVTVHYRGILPDLFREGQGIVTQGMLGDQGVFEAQEVLAKHDENYMPPEVKAALAAGEKKALMNSFKSEEA